MADGGPDIEFDGAFAFEVSFLIYKWLESHVIYTNMNKYEMMSQAHQCHHLRLTPTK
jgi:hypothetical protein